MVFCGVLVARDLLRLATTIVEIWTKEDMIRFLQTGKSPTGREPSPPMPPFRMTEEDETSVALYLSSIGRNGDGREGG